MFFRLLITSLLISLLFLSACAGSENTPINETAPPNNDIPASQDVPDDEASEGIPWDLVGSVSILSNGIEYEPHLQLQHIGVTTSGGQMSGSAPPPPTIEEFLELLPKIQYYDDFQVVIDGAYAGRVSYSLYEIEDFKQSYSEGVPLVEMEDLHFPEAAGTYILVVSVFWSDSDSHENYVYYSYSSMIL